MVETEGGGKGKGGGGCKENILLSLAVVKGKIVVRGQLPRVGARRKS